MCNSLPRKLVFPKAREGSIRTTILGYVKICKQQYRVNGTCVQVLEVALLLAT